MFLVLPSAPELASLVPAYWFIQDFPGEHEGKPIKTNPIPFAVLSVNIGRPNATEFGNLVPKTSLLGLQARVRSWRSWADTYFVMAMMTIPGLVRFFPNTGPDSAETLLDLAAVIGDRPSHFLANDVDAAVEPRRIADRLDHWFLDRLSRTEVRPECGRVMAAYAVLSKGGGVEAAARAAEVSRRQIHRWFIQHTGIGPKELGVLERLHSSLQSVQSGQGNAHDGFSDQAHQIRNWRQRLGVTPGVYSRAPRSPMAAYFASVSAATTPAFYL